MPPHHGVRDNGGFFLDEAKVTLAERLKDAGFATGAFVAAWVLESKWGLAQGFDEYSDTFDLSKYKVVSLGTVQKPGDEVMDGALAWLETVKQRRFFAWVHLYDPHTPYDPPEPFDSRYPNQPYLGEIAYTDQVVGRLTSWLREQGLIERTLVVLTADHGESLGEHGESTHAYFIYDATTRVPLVVRTPWGVRGRRAVQTSGVDVMPTVLDLLGLAARAGHRRPLARARAARPRRGRRPRRVLGDLLPALPLRLAAPAGARAACSTSTSTPPSRSSTTCRPTRARRRTSTAASRAAPRSCGCGSNRSRRPKPAQHPSGAASTPRRCSGSRRSATSAT